MYGNGQRQGNFVQNKNTESLLSIDEREKPVSLQMFGSDPQIMAQIAKQIEERPLTYWISTWAVRCPKS